MEVRSRPIRYGVAVGLIAYFAVAAFYAAFDLLAARGPLYTVNQLGLALFRGVRDTAGLGLPTAIDLTAIALYNTFHLAASLAIGLVVTTLVEYAHRQPQRAPTTLLVIIAGFVVTVGLVGAVTTGVRPVVPWWSIILANAGAVVLAGAYLLRRYPTVFRRLTVDRVL